MWCMNNRIIIDPTRLSQNDKLILGYLSNYFLDNRKQQIMPQGVCDLPPEILSALNCKTIYLTHSIYWRLTSDGLGQRGEIFGTVQGKGSFKVGIKGANVLMLEQGRIIGTKQKPHILLGYQKKEDRERLKEEMNHSSCAMHLRFKPLTDACIGVMRLFPGQEVFQIIDKEWCTKETLLSLDARLELCIKILEAWLREVDLNLLFHRDIKPENIIVNVGDENNISCHFVDYDYAVSQSHAQKRDCGSVFYVAPEVALNISLPTEQSEVFSLVKVLAAIWHADFIVDLSEDKLKKKLKQKDASDLLSYGQLFVGLGTVDAAIQTGIKEIVAKTLHNNLEQRLSVYDILQRLAAIRLKRKLAFGHFVDKKAISDANQCALDIHQKLHQAIKLALEDKQHDILAIYDPIIKLINSDSRLIDTKEAIQEFTHVLSIPELQGAQMKQEIIDQLNAIIISYQENLSTLKSFLDELKLLEKESFEKTNLIRAITALIKKSQSYHHGIDNLVLFDEKFRKMLEKSKVQLKLIPYPNPIAEGLLTQGVFAANPIQGQKKCWPKADKHVTRCSSH